MIAEILPIIKNPWAFYIPAGLIMAYLVYMMVRRRKGEQPGQDWREPEL